MGEPLLWQGLNGPSEKHSMMLESIFLKSTQTQTQPPHLPKTPETQMVGYIIIQYPHHGWIYNYTISTTGSQTQMPNDNFS